MSFLSPPLVASIGIPLGLGVLGSLSTRPAIQTWYKDLKKPKWNPPNWVFGPVWTFLYISMGIASHRIYQLPPPVRQPALTVYAVSLGLNALWSPLFFSAKRIGLALVDIVGLWGTVGASTVMFYQRDRVAGALMVPYIAWVSLATALNFWIWRNNDQKKVNKKK